MKEIPKGWKLYTLLKAFLARLQARQVVQQRPLMPGLRLAHYNGYLMVRLSTSPCVAEQPGC